MYRDTVHCVSKTIRFATFNVFHSFESVADKFLIKRMHLLLIAPTMSDLVLFGCLAENTKHPNNYTFSVLFGP